MALQKIIYHSEQLNMKMGVNVIIPENKWGYSLADRPFGYKYPVLWLLCGGGFDYSDWQRYTAVELFAAQEGIAVVMPSAYYSGYMDTVHGDYRYFSQITRELPPFLRSLFPLSKEREDNFVAGFSMGGYGSFKWAMQQPEMFAACGVFSGPVGIVPQTPVKLEIDQIGLRENETDPAPEAFRTMLAAFGSAKDRRNTPDDNLYMLKQYLKKGTRLPLFYISTGQEDAVAVDNYQHADTMHEMGLDFVDIRDHGKHNWEYCNRKIEEFIGWIPLKNTIKMEEE